MNNDIFYSFTDHLQKSLSTTLPGIDAQFRMVPPMRTDYPPMDMNNVRLGAILALFFPCGDDARLVFIRRQIYQGVHSDQISFPGGAFEKDDLTFDRTAIREANEETGVPAADIRLHGELTELYIPPSNFLVRSFVGSINYQPEFRPDPTEVREVFSVPVSQLLAGHVCQQRPVKVNSADIDVPCFMIEDKMIWGATAMILSELVEVIRFFPKNRFPWNKDVLNSIK